MGRGQEREWGRESPLLFHPGRGMRKLGLGAGDRGARHMGGEEREGPDGRHCCCGRRTMVTFPSTRV